MKTTIDHLLTPRFEVIAEYPGSTWKLGSIINSDFTYLNHSDKGYPAQFPNLFKKLNWWEKRTEEEMPRYLKMDINKSGDWDYSEVKYWDMENTMGVLDDSNQRKLSVCDVLLYTPEYTYQPCSEEEYLANQ